MKHRSHRRALPHGMEVSARSYLADLCVSAASTDGRRQSRSAVSGALLVPWTRTSTGQRSFATYLKPSDHQNCRSLHSSASSRPTQIAIPHWPTREPIAYICHMGPTPGSHQWPTKGMHIQHQTVLAAAVGVVYRRPALL